MSKDFERFDKSDKEYQAWLKKHYRDGFVLNTRRYLPPDYMVLHRASCPKISEYTNMAKPGGFTERRYIKICASDISTLEIWVRQNGRPDGTFSARCPVCDPY